MDIKTVPQPPYSPDLAPCDFWLFPKLRDCHDETIEEMKEAVMKIIAMLTQENFHGAFQKLLECYNKYIAAGGDYFEGGESFMRVLSIKVPIRKKSGNLFNDPCICVCLWIGVCIFMFVCMDVCVFMNICVCMCVWLYHHHHHIMLVARISLTLSRHSSLSFIALGRSSGQHPVSSHSCWMYVRAGRPAFARPSVGIHKSTSLMS